MYSVLTRSNSVAAYSLTVLAVLTLLCFLSTAFFDYRRTVNINTVTAVVKKVPNYNTGREMNDLGYIRIDLETNLNPLFNWNVRQLFLYLTAEYTTEANAINQVVLWDKIIKRGENANLKYKNMNLKYYFWDDGNGLRGNQNITLVLSWNIIPNAGCLPHVTSPSLYKFSFPSDYTTSRK